MLPMSNIARPGSGVIDPELHEINFQIPSDESGIIVIVPEHATLHAIHQAYLNEYCRFIGKEAPTLMRDVWDNGVTRSGMEDILRTMRVDDLKNLSLSQQEQAQDLLLQWGRDLDAKLQALKRTDGYCFGRHAHSKAIENHIIKIWHGAVNLQINLFVRAGASADLNVLKKWITRGIDVNSADSTGRTALIALLDNKAEREEDRRKIDDCANYLLSVEGIDPCQRGVQGNAFGSAIRNGHESIAVYLIKNYSLISIDSGLGTTAINNIARNCPKVLDHMKEEYVALGASAIAALYLMELPFVPAQDRKWSRPFYLDVVNEMSKTNVAEAQKALLALEAAARRMNDTGMLEALRTGGIR